MDNHNFHHCFYAQQRILITVLFIVWIFYNVYDRVSKVSDRQRGGVRKQRAIQVVTGRRPIPLPHPPRPPSVLTTLSKPHTDNFNKIYPHPIRQPSTQHEHRSSPAHKNQKSCHSQLHLATQNARSSRNKTTLINDMIVEEDIDLLVVTESWLRDKEEHILQEMLPTGYSALAENRSSGQLGGGVLAIFKTSLQVIKITNDYDFKIFEHIELLVTHKNICYRVLGVYRPPPSIRNKNSTSLFLNEFEHFLIDKATENGKLIIIGDFNFHVDDTSDDNATRFLNLINSFNLRQHVTESTHNKGHVLDVVINSISDTSISKIHQTNYEISDHNLISVTLENTKPRPLKKTITYKKTKSIDIDKFKEDINSFLIPAMSKLENVNEKVETYNSILKNIFDEHAPDKTKTITIRPNNGTWYTEELRTMKKSVRKLEKTWRISKKKHVEEGIDQEGEYRLDEIRNKEIYKKARKELNKMIKTAKNDRLKELIGDHKNNKKELFKIVNGIISPDSQPKLPDFNTASDLASDFNFYFEEKIVNIRSELDSCDHISSSEHSSSSCLMDTTGDCVLDEWSSTTIQDLVDIMNRLPNKSCSLDPIPTWLLKECKEDLAPVILDIVTTSLADSTVPDCLKKAVIKPLLKKPSLDRNELKNYRPVSNLCTLSKILEKVVSSKLNSYLDGNNFRPVVQSAYRKGHCTESALVKVHNDIISYVADRKTAVLILLDLSAAFDTIDQKLLLNRLQTDFRIKDNVLAWFQSYLSGRTQCVAIDDSFSKNSFLHFGVPQGSVLGPLLYTLYTAPICSIITAYDLKFHLYADDTQIYFPVTEDTKHVIVPCVENCVKEIKDWMVLNKLKLNEDKTEIISFYGNNRKKAEVEFVNIAGSYIKVLNGGNVRNLGAYFDSRLCMDTHVNKIVQSCQFHLQRISRIRHLLDIETMKILIVSFVLSRIDYCNALLKSAPKYVIEKLQKLENRAARMVMNCGFRDHITPILKDLHWLPVHLRIDFKILDGHICEVGSIIVEYLLLEFELECKLYLSE